MRNGARIKFKMRTTGRKSSPTKRFETSKSLQGVEKSYRVFQTNPTYIPIAPSKGTETFYLPLPFFFFFAYIPIAPSKGTETFAGYLQALLPAPPTFLSPRRRGLKLLGFEHSKREKLSYIPIAPSKGTETLQSPVAVVIELVPTFLSPRRRGLKLW